MLQCSRCLALFFFSSRRRHTRYIGDWSSDVCSSDLVVGAGRGGAGVPPAFTAPPAASGCPGAPARTGRPPRSEERRVGKECRSPGLPEHSQNKERPPDGQRSELKSTRRALKVVHAEN